MRDEVRLLLAEDDENDAIFFIRAFKKAGIDAPVEIVKDGLAAVRRLSDLDRPRVTHVLLDLKMPLKTGLEVLEWMAERGAGGPRAAVFSSSKVEEDVERAYRGGADFYLVKPARTSDLVRICEELGAWLGSGLRPALSPDILLPRPG
jgi:CheY-like chemotaxis protein